MIPTAPSSVQVEDWDIPTVIEFDKIGPFIAEIVHKVLIQAALCRRIVHRTIISAR